MKPQGFLRVNGRIIVYPETPSNVTGERAMKFSINQAELGNALSIVQKGVSARSTLPILAGIYLEAHHDSIVFQTTDLDLSIQFTCTALVEEAGAAVLPGKLLVDIVKSLPDAAVHISTDSETATITCDNSSFSIKSLNAQDWPGFPFVETDQQISIPFETFSTMAKKVSNVVSRDDSRPILTGVLITLEDGMLKMVATDSYRLSVTQRLSDRGETAFSAVVSGAFVAELAALPKSGDDISIALAENQIVVSYKGTSFVNRRIEGKYPNYKRLLPSSHATRAVVDTAALAAAVKRAALLGSSGSSVRFSISPEAQIITVSSVRQDVGSTQEVVPAQVEGESCEIAFNSSYVGEGLNSAPSESVALELQGSMKPGIFKDTSSGDYLYLVMPVRLS